MYKVIYSEARNFYSFINNEVAMQPINKEIEIMRLCNYSYDPDLPLQDGVIDHDYWDHFLPPTPWLWEDLGFIPPTPLGECFADIVGDMRVGGVKSRQILENIVKVFENKVKHYSKYGEIDFDPSECALPLEHWVLKVQLFWKLYPGDVPRYV